MSLDSRTKPGQPQILAISASPRQGGNCDTLLQSFAAGANRVGVQTEIIHLRDCAISPCVGCELCRKLGTCKRFEDDMLTIYPKIIAAKGLILASPVHNYNITAWMKAFIDRLYCFYNFVDQRPGPWSSKLADQGRKAVVTAVSEQTDKKDMGFTIEAMQWPLEALGYEVIDLFPVLGIFAKEKLQSHQIILLLLKHMALNSQQKFDKKLLRRS
jgi:multimeric flavodoxin WrbA